MDKKFLTALLLMAAACTNTMEYKPTTSGPQLMMNAQMSVGEEYHAVFLALSKPGGVDPLTGSVKVLCFVNGSQTAQAVEADAALWPNAKESRQRVFIFKADFKPGDEVKLTATTAGHEASALATVPAPALILKADTLTVRNKGYEYLTFPTSIKDVGEGPDYYCIDIALETDAEMYSEEEYLKTVSFHEQLYVDASDDYIISGEKVSGSTIGNIFSGNNFKYFQPFLDRQFEGGEAKLLPKVERFSVDNVYIEINDESVDSVYVKPKVKLSVSHILGRHYYYLKALNQIRQGASSNLNMEETAIPDNVEGGIGFVGIANPVSAEFVLKNRGFPVF